MRARHSGLKSISLARAHNLYNAGLLLISCPIFLMRPFTSGHANIYLVECNTGLARAWIRASYIYFTLWLAFTLYIPW